MILSAVKKQMNFKRKARQSPEPLSREITSVKTYQADSILTSTGRLAQ